MSVPAGDVPVEGVLLDLDGTLLDTGPDFAVAVNAMRARFGLGPLAESRVTTFVGKGAARLVHRAMCDDLDGELPDPLADEALEVFLAEYARINGRHARLYEGVVPGLQALHAAGLPLACVTNKPQAFSEALLERFDLARWFATVVGGDAVPRRKPDPAPMLEAARRLACSPGGLAVVGDSINDALAARAAGMRVWLVAYGYNEGRPLDLLDCDGIVTSVDDAARRFLEASPASRPSGSIRP